MKIPFVDLKSQYNSIKEEIDNAISLVIQETAFIGGKYVTKFEEDFSTLYGVKHCISVANGTDSLYIIMKMLGIGEGDEVITVANSWISSSETISQTGAKPVFIDINPDLYSIDENKIEEAITPRTKAIMPVHLFGQICEMEKIISIAKKYNLEIIEDCAQAHFSEYKGKRAGTFGVAGSFSFYPGKNLGAYGDAGCIITNNDEFALKCKMYARHGALKKHEHQMEGINSRLDGLQAAILSAKLPHILNWTKARINCSNRYTEILKDINQIVLPVTRDQSLHTFHLYVVRAKDRNELKEYLHNYGIETAIHYPVILPNMIAYQYLGYNYDSFPVASSYEDQILSLPIYPEMKEEQIIYVCEKIKDFYASK